MIILPSSQSNFFDYTQKSPINNEYPSPKLFGSGAYFLDSGILYSGIYFTYPSGQPSQSQSGIFQYVELSGLFSNYEQHKRITSFQLFNSYIHYYPKFVEGLNDINKNNMDDPGKQLEIPYISSYKINLIPFNPYGT